jgi:hypothetical protein
LGRSQGLRGTRKNFDQVRNFPALARFRTVAPPSVALEM